MRESPDVETQLLYILMYLTYISLLLIIPTYLFKKFTYWEMIGTFLNDQIQFSKKNGKDGFN